MAISQDIISEIKYKNDIESVVSQYIVLKRRGKNLIGLCPFHNEKTPSFTIYPENGSFYCFGCKVGGDVITFTSLIEHLDYVESLKFLADKSSIQIIDRGYEDNSLQKLKQTILEINRETARFYHNYLMSEKGKWALDYLLDRGLTRSTIIKFGLGCAPDSWDLLLKHLSSKGYTIGDMLQANVITKSQRGTYFDRFRNRVIFPIINLRGNVIAFSGRSKPGDEKASAKYVNTSDTPVYKKSENLFAFNYAKNNCADRIILVEGNMDVISLHQAGFTNTVAALGTSFTIEQAKLISRYTKEVVVLFDSDSAGQNAVNKALSTLKNSGMNIRVLVLPEGKDPDEFIKKNSPDKLKLLLDGSESDIDYKLRTASYSYNLNSNDGKLNYLKSAAKILADTDDELTIDLYTGKLAENYGFSKNSVESAVKKLRESKIKQKLNKEIAQVVSPRFSRDSINPEKQFNKKVAVAEEAIISVLFAHPDYFYVIEDELPPNLFVTSLNQKIYWDIFNALREGKNIDISLFGEKYNPNELGYIVSLQSSVNAERNALQVLRDSIEVIKGYINSSITDSDSDDEWATKMEEIAKHKKGE